MPSVQAATVKIVQASKFELVDESGKQRAILAVDADHRSVLEFLGEHGETRSRLGISSDGSPFLALIGSDSKVRAVLHLDKTERPSLAMSDESWQGRAVLGFLAHDSPPSDGDWLLFRAPGAVPDFASIGVLKNRAEGSLTGRVSVRSTSGKVWTTP